MARAILVPIMPPVLRETGFGTSGIPTRRPHKFFAISNYSQIQSVVSMTRIAIIFV
jgi:hypothetical protein